LPGGVDEIINDIRRDGHMFSKHITVQDAGLIAMPLLTVLST